jgi:two-component system, LuxR family, response regulator FixJ
VCPNPLTHAVASAPTVAATVSDRPTRMQTTGAICVVDDDVWVCDSLSTLLAAYGFEVLAFASGAEFLAHEQHRGARCLIIDHHMPGMDGFDVIVALHIEGLLVPTVLITGRLEAGVRERAAELGVIAVLEKPFAATGLIELIRTGLDGRV